MIGLEILIYSDNINIVNIIKENLENFSDKHKIFFSIDQFCNNIELYSNQKLYDIGFIDFETSEINGLTLITLLKKKNKNIIIFVITSYECYLDDAMDLGIFRYITKPIDNERFSRAIKAAVKFYHSNTQIITLEYYDECYSIFTDGIIYITTENQKAIVITQKRRYITNQRISYWKNKLRDIPYFSQIHCSYIVNMQYITYFNKTEVHLCVNSEKTTILPISQRNYYNFKKKYFSYIGV